MHHRNCLEVHNLQVEFSGDGAQVQAINGISFDLPQGQTLGIVGESGSGKSVTALTIMGLLPYPGQVTGGQILFRNQKKCPTPRFISSTLTGNPALPWWGYGNDFSRTNDFPQSGL